MSKPSAIDHEEATLRAAGVILDTLADGEAHVWREVVDDLDVPNRRMAQSIAWAALRRHIDPNYYVIWGGEKGARWIALYDEARILRAACPDCGADPGASCVRRNGHEKVVPHKRRQVAALMDPVAEDAELAEALDAAMADALA